MDAVEKAVRNALGKGDAGDPAFRERVYASAAAALERAIAGKLDLPAETADRRRAQLRDRIADIETEFVPAAPQATAEEVRPPAEEQVVGRGEAAEFGDAGEAGGQAAAPEVGDEERRPDHGVHDRLDQPDGPRDDFGGAYQPQGDPHRAGEPFAEAAPVQSTDAYEAVDLDPEELAPSPDSGPNDGMAWPRSADQRQAPVFDAGPPALDPIPGSDFYGLRGPADRIPAPDPALDRADERPMPEDDFIPRPEARPADPSAVPDFGDMRAEVPPGWAEVPPGWNERHGRGPARPVRLILALLAMAVVALAIWWLVKGGVPVSEENSGGAQAPVVNGEPPQGGSVALPGELEAEENWITVFSPSDPTRARAPSGATAEVKSEGDDRFLRIEAGDGGQPFVFSVGQGILESLAGKRAVFRIVARAPGDEETQMAVACDFAGFGDCGRKRYAVGPTRADYLLETEFPDAAPGGGGSISLTPDISGGNAAIDIFAIQASVAN